MNETALYKKWLVQMIEGATDLRLLKIAYGFMNRLFSGSEAGRA